ncbi:type I glyceraldehyde-3-phosphate dehydrogenase [Kibdelosporangium philippinense]|uniref:Type I glyceraldehyde-3-phosphate dehydrogenase n=1 Tax=Kibdelosporangium philippinense TaxID=211113 RepID=A0ABS8ZDB8_9PSEU|nr:type I glyceraldehyde-3-phosphate dehydrogenase [Kibdelosporangium philippinense]MCE7004661.1 type I glyceraldehyde-3-phosphate dehydrogenase [Kibdelosporangium philippinense]
MTVRVGINGFGRIGRDVLRCVFDRDDTDIEIVAINDVTSAETLAHLLKYDSTYGTWAREVSATWNTISIDDKTITVLNERNPKDIPWNEFDVEVVLESSGKFRTKDAASWHLSSGAYKVVISAPGKDVDATIVLGVNSEHYDPATHDVISNASCTTNCVAPMVEVLHRNFVVQRGLMTTIHSYTNDQALIDSPHKDLRRARSAAVNIIPTTTGAARAVGLVIPDLAGKLDGIAVRVPVEDGSLTDLAVEVSEPVTAEQVNQAFKEASESYLKGILRYTEAPVVSRDIIGDPSSCVFDASLTMADERMVKVFGWYDNEWGYASRTVDLMDQIGKTL